MTERVHIQPALVFTAGTQVVTLREIRGDDGLLLHPSGAVGVVVKAPTDGQHGYQVRFSDGVETSLGRAELAMLAHFKEGELSGLPEGVAVGSLFDRVIYRCVIGSRAYGLETEDSDTDRRGIFLPSADRHWSLSGVPEQIENDSTQEAYWELQKFLVLALKANPNVLECLYTPLVETATPLASELLGLRESFLSKLVYQTFNGYVLSQFKKMQADIRNHGSVKWKHVMHLIRLLLSGIKTLRERHVVLDVGEHREPLRAIKRGELSWDEIDRWRLSLHQEFDAAYSTTALPERPDYGAVNAFLIKARRAASGDGLP